MSLKWKIVLLLSLVYVSFLLTTRIIQTLVFEPSFAALERQHATDDIERCVDALRHEVDHLALFCGDWSAWDDTCDFVEGRAPEYVRKNMMPSTFTSNRLNLLCICDVKGRIAWLGAFRLPSMETLRLSQFSGAVLPPGSPLLRHPDTRSVVKGLMLTDHGPMLVCSRPIISSEEKGPIRGALIMGRLLDGTDLEAIAGRIRVRMTARVLQGDAVPPEERAILKELTGSSPVVFREGEGILQVYTLFPDIEGRPAMLVRADVPRLISERAQAMMVLATVSDTVAGAIIILLTWHILHRMVVRPLAVLTGHARRVGRDGPAGPPLVVRGRDEIGLLGREFNRMVIRLAESQATLLEAAHRAGMVETATAVLHNIGNALNTVGVSTQLLNERVRQSPVADLREAVTLLRERAGGPAEEREAAVAYLARLADVLIAENDQMLDAIGSIRQKVRHVEQIIATQQRIAHGPAFAQPVDPVSIIEEILDHNGEALARHRVQVRREYGALPRVPMNADKLRQVLQNLVTNAVEAMTSAGDGPRCLTVRARSESSEWVCIEVSDTGIGIAEASRDRIFQHGYTTKPEGHGFGLHFCAIAVAEMGGRIAVHSDGVGRGATFSVRLPAGEVQGVRE